jgi:hypothetical protein
MQGPIPHPPQSIPIDDLDDPDPGLLPVDPDDGPVAPLIREDPEHDRVIDPED